MVRFPRIFRRTQGGFGSQYRHMTAVVSFNHDGLEIARVRNDRRWLPLWHIAVFIYLAMLIRLVTIADIGPASYANRMEQMHNGNVAERVAARVMQLDPISHAVAVRLRAALHGL